MAFLVEMIIDRNFETKTSLLFFVTLSYFPFLGVRKIYFFRIA
jgi:hypothetical protein